MATSPRNPPAKGINVQTRQLKGESFRISPVAASGTLDYAEILAGDGAPSGGYGRDASATMLYFRKDATTVPVAMYVTVDGGTTWNAVVAASTAGSTAASGTDAASAGALPAGFRLLPTTAADDIKGVIIHASDKVSGRELFIGNGVVNKILKVYPPTGGTINGAAANAAYSSASGKGVHIFCLDSTANTWLATG